MVWKRSFPGYCGTGRMNRVTAYLTLGLLLTNYKLGWSISTHTYGVIEESLFFATSALCLFFALMIFLSLKGGSLGRPWLFIFIGFLMAVAGSGLHLLDLFRILIYQYDFRLAFLILSCGSMVFLLIGLILIRRGLE